MLDCLVGVLGEGDQLGKSSEVGQLGKSSEVGQVVKSSEVGEAGTHFQVEVDQLRTVLDFKERALTD